MKDSTKRTIRTLVQGVLAAGAVVAVAVPLVPKPTEGRIAAALAAAVVVAATLAKVWATLEEAGLIPEWLRSDEQHFEAGFVEGKSEAARLATEQRMRNDVTMVRGPLEGFPPRPAEPGFDSPPVSTTSGEHAIVSDEQLGAEYGSRADQLASGDRPGRHSVDRAGAVPTSLTGRQLGPYGAAAPVSRPAPTEYEMSRRPWL